MSPPVPVGIHNIDPLGIIPPPGSSTIPTSTPGQMTPNAVKVVGFTIGALALVGLSRVAPTGAVFISVAILLGVALTHSTEISTLVTRLQGAIGNSGNSSTGSNSGGTL